jgi:hypothetical protein
MNFFFVVTPTCRCCCSKSRITKPKSHHHHDSKPPLLVLRSWVLCHSPQLTSPWDDDNRLRSIALPPSETKQSEKAWLRTTKSHLIRRQSPGMSSIGVCRQSLPELDTLAKSTRAYAKHIFIFEREKP